MTKKLVSVLFSVVILSGCAVSPALHGRVEGNSHGTFYAPSEKAPECQCQNPIPHRRAISLKE